MPNYNKTHKTKVSELENDAGYVTDDYVDSEISSALSSVYTVKGSKTNYSDLPSSGNKKGDVWNVVNANGNTPAGTNYVWNGNAWDALGGTIDLSGYATTTSVNNINSALTTHTNNKSNPHSVTKSQIGLGNVDNTADANKIVKGLVRTGNTNNNNYNIWFSSQGASNQLGYNDNFTYNPSKNVLNISGRPILGGRDYLITNGIQSAGVGQNNVLLGNYYTSGSLNLIDQLLTSGATNKLAYLSPDFITIEYSQDGGNTWIDSGYNRTEKSRLFNNDSSWTNFKVGVPSNATSMPSDVTESTKDLYKTRVIIGRDSGRYALYNKFIFNISTATNLNVKLEYTTWGNKETWQLWRDNTTCNGWTGPNAVTLPEKSAFGDNNSNHIYNIKITFSYAVTPTSHTNRANNFGDFKFFGPTNWGETSYSHNLFKQERYDTTKQIIPNTSLCGNKTVNIGGWDNNQWNKIFGVEFIENQTSLCDKYLGKTATATNSTKLNNQEASYYLNYNNLTNKPSIPTAYTHPTYTSKSSGLYKIIVDGTGHISAATAVAKSDITALGIPGSDTNTHFTTGITAGATETTSNSATTNGNTYIKIKDDSTHRSQIKISGSGATSVSSDANGNITISSTDTKNTAGSTDTSSKIFLIGATQQAANPQTYSQDTAYVGTDGCLYSNSTKVSVEGHTHSQYLTSNAVTSVAGKTGAVTLSKSDVGLGSVGNFKAVSTAASQGLTETEKSNARNNIGAAKMEISGSTLTITL